MSGASFKMNMGPMERRIGAAVSHLANTRVLMARLGEGLVSGVRQRFKDEEGPDGDPWPKSARARAEGGQTLTDKARLKNSIGYEATDKDVAVGTNVEYAAIHQFGGEIKPKSKKALQFQVPGGDFVTVKKVDMPARPFIGISKEDQIESRRICAEFMRQGLTKK